MNKLEKQKSYSIAAQKIQKLLISYFIQI